MMLLKKSTNTLALKILSSLSSLFLNFIIARLFLPEVAGVFFLALTIVVILAQLSRLGTDSHVVRKLATNSDSVLCTNVFFILIFLSLLFSISVVIFSGEISSLLDTPALFKQLDLMAISIVFYSLANHFAFRAQAIGNSYIFVLASNLIQVFITAVILLAFYVFGFTNEETIGLSYTLGCAIGLIITVFLVSKNTELNISISKFNLTKSLHLIKQTLPLFVSTCLQLVVVWMSQFLVAVYFNSDNVALFTISQRIAMLTSFILVAVNSVVSPRFSKLYASNEMENLRDIAQASTLIGILFLVPFMLVVMIVPSNILSIFGEYYANGSSILIVLCIGQCINVLTGGVGYLLQMAGFYKHILIANCLGAVSMIILFSPLIESLGLIGAALLSVIGVLVTNLYLFIMVKVIFGFFTFSLNLSKLKNTLRTW